jgi:sucrose phosphorylase
MSSEDRPSSPPWGGQFRGLRFLLEADFSGPLFEVPAELEARMRSRLSSLYGEDRTDTLYGELERLLRVHQAHATDEIITAEANFDPRERFTEQDVVLITYGDLIVSEGRSPLRTLADFAQVFFRGLISTLHILPFYPYSSDRGFSVISFEEVDPHLGTWDDIAGIEAGFKLMFDGVFNHVSSKSHWFQQFLAGDPDYRDYFVGFSTREAIDEDHLRLILRPRTTPLLNEFHTIDGPRWVWTTFSRDQVDLNFKNPKVLLKIVEILLYYVRRGADLIRLDAITYLWSEFGTSCAHLGEVHEVVRLFRDLLDAVAPHVALVTETNVPHADNITYFGDGSDEAQMVYNFALPPLVLHAFQTGDASVLTEWAEGLVPPSDTTGFFNFLDSHDGIGVMGARGILSEEQILAMCARAEPHGGFVSSKTNGDGTESPYELNITWYSALNRMDSGEPIELQLDRFVASRALAMVLRGVPGIYLPSLIGHRNDTEAVFHEGSQRSINRSRIDEGRLLEVLQDSTRISSRIAERFIDLLERRIVEPAFHPAAPQRILSLDPRVFAVLRTALDGSARILCLTNVSGEEVTVEVDCVDVFGPELPHLRELVHGEPISTDEGRVAVDLAPYRVGWIKGTPHQGGAA